MSEIIQVSMEHFQGNIKTAGRQKDLNFVTGQVGDQISNYAYIYSKTKAGGGRYVKDTKKP